MSEHTEVGGDDVWGKVRRDVKHAIAATITRNWHGPGEIVVQLWKRTLEIRRWWPILQFPHTGVVSFAVFTEQGEEPANCDLSFGFCDTIHDHAAMIAVSLNEVLGGPFYVEFVKNSFDNKRAPLDPNLSKSFLCERRVVECHCRMKGSIILWNDRVRI